MRLTTSRPCPARSPHAISVPPGRPRAAPARPGLARRLPLARTMIHAAATSGPTCAPAADFETPHSVLEVDGDQAAVRRHDHVRPRQVPVHQVRRVWRAPPERVSTTDCARASASSCRRPVMQVRRERPATHSNKTQVRDPCSARPSVTRVASSPSVLASTSGTHTPCWRSLRCQAASTADVPSGWICSADPPGTRRPPRR